MHWTYPRITFIKKNIQKLRTTDVRKAVRRGTTRSVETYLSRRFLSPGEVARFFKRLLEDNTPVIPVGID